MVGIGKTLRPSFQLDDDVQAFIGDSLQQSKRTRVRFDKDIIYTVARRGYTILRRTIGGTYKVMPYGREVKVQVDFATDHSTGDYQVPTVYVTTDDGTPITSKSYYWDGKVRIDGAGVFPDLPETPMQIKGRGNSSWTTSGKAPYHMKFETALKVLGLKKGKHWNLIANAQNRSMTSNAVAMKMAQLVEQLVGHLEGVEMVCSMDSDVSEDDCAQCAKEAFESLLADGAIRRPRDYAWIMMAMNQGAIDDFETFRSHQDFIDYLKEIGLQNVPSRTTLYSAENNTMEEYPNWMFLDNPKTSEALRRTNLVKQFLSAYRRAKRALLNE